MREWGWTPCRPRSDCEAQSLGPCRARGSLRRGLQPNPAAVLLTTLLGGTYVVQVLVRTRSSLGAELRCVLRCNQLLRPGLVLILKCEMNSRHMCTRTIFLVWKINRVHCHWSRPREYTALERVTWWPLLFTRYGLLAYLFLLAKPYSQGCLKVRASSAKTLKGKLKARRLHLARLTRPLTRLTAHVRVLYVLILRFPKTLATQGLTVSHPHASHTPWPLPA